MTTNYHCGDCDPCLGGRPDQCIYKTEIQSDPTQLATPLRAEPYFTTSKGWMYALYDSTHPNAKPIAIELTKETAALIVGMSEDAKRLAWLEALVKQPQIFTRLYVHNSADLGYTENFISFSVEPGNDARHVQGKGDTLRQAIDKAALAAGDKA